MIALAALLAAAFAAVHLFAGKLRFLDAIPRSRWLSFASGISVAYVFVHLLPELAEGERALAESGVADLVPAAEARVWMIALAGLAVFYGLEILVRRSREDREEEEGRDVAEPGVFWLHMASFSVYNVLVGYLLLHREESGVAALVLYGVAMALHFFVNDYGLRQDHKRHYHDRGRWILAAAVGVGFGLGAVTSVGEHIVIALTALLGGGVVMNVLKEELPEERESRFWPFLLGVAAYTALLLVAE